MTYQRTNRPALHTGPRCTTGYAIWGDDLQAAGSIFKPLSREQAAVLRANEPPLSPWRVIVAQAVVGVAAALIGGLVTARIEVVGAMLYGAATVGVPGALMARGMTSRLSSQSPSACAVSFMLWSSVKIIFSLVMLALASRVVQPLVWPALLVGLVVCIKVYWLALLWRHPKKNLKNETTDHGL